MRPGFLVSMAGVALVGAVALGVAPIFSNALPPQNWLALAFATVGVALTMVNLSYTVRKEQRETADREEKRQLEEQERARAADEARRQEQARANYRAQFKTLTLPPASALGDRTFVYEWPAGWEALAPERTADPHTDEECLWIMAAAWQVEGKRDGGFIVSEGAKVLPPHRFIYETDSEHTWRRKIVRSYSSQGSGGKSGPPMLVVLAPRGPGDHPQHQCFRCWAFFTEGIGCRMCGQTLQQVQATNDAMLAERRGVPPKTN